MPESSGVGGGGDGFGGRERRARERGWERRANVGWRGGAVGEVLADGKELSGVQWTPAL